MVPLIKNASGEDMATTGEHRNIGNEMRLRIGYTYTYDENSHQHHHCFHQRCEMHRESINF